MNKKEEESSKQPPVNVEFGMEFGDVNAAKWFDRPHAGKQEREEKGKKKD